MDVTSLLTKSLIAFFISISPDGSFNISSDGGATWGIISNDLPLTTDLWNKTRLITIPDNAGHLFINIQNKLWKSTNGGRNWTQVVSVNQAQSLTFGAGFDVYPALYIFGRLSAGSNNYFYRSDDAGQSWIRINEHSEKELWSSIRTIAGDRNIPGRLYAAASGQGVIFGGKANDLANPDTTGDDVTGDPGTTKPDNTGDDVISDSDTTESDNTDDNVIDNTDTIDSNNTGDDVIGVSDTTESDNTGDEVIGVSDGIDNTNTKESDNTIGDSDTGSVIEDINHGGGGISLFFLFLVFWIKTFYSESPFRRFNVPINSWTRKRKYTGQADGNYQ